MRRAFLMCASILVLSACTGHAEHHTYGVRVDIDDEAKRAKLFVALEDVVERMFVSQMMDHVIVTVVPGEEEGTLQIDDVRTPEEEEAVSGLLAAPFSFVIKRSGADAKNEDGSRIWTETGLDGEDVEWIEPLTNPKDETAVANIIFTEGGREAFQNVLAETDSGALLGIFVRDLLVSQFTVREEVLEDKIVILGIPTYEQAKIFADDVNTGLHVELTPQ